MKFDSAVVIVMPAEGGIHVSGNRAADGVGPGLRRNDERLQFIRENWRKKWPGRKTVRAIARKAVSLRSPDFTRRSPGRSKPGHDGVRSEAGSFLAITAALSRRCRSAA